MRATVNPSQALRERQHSKFRDEWRLRSGLYDFHRASDGKALHRIQSTSLAAVGWVYGTQVAHVNAQTLHTVIRVNLSEST
jgi:hypothetical protein